MKILIIGETCQDKYIFGDSKRVSPESGAQIFVCEKQSESWGMASNLYRNILSILNRHYKKDKDEVDIMTNQLTREHISKTRYVVERTNTTLLRVDTGDHLYGHISEHYENFNLKDNSLSFFQKLSKYDGILISDYDKGFLTEQDIELISSLNANTFIDTKKILGEWCKNVKFIKVNQEEYDKNLSYIQNHPEIKERLLITKGAQGAQYKNDIFPVKKIMVRGISGCGDSWFGSFCIDFMKNKDIPKAIKFANKIATICASQPGVSIPYEY